MRIGPLLHPCPRTASSTGRRRTLSRCAILALVAALAAPASCAGPSPGPRQKKATSVTVAVTTWPASAPIYIAKEKGYFADEGLDARLEDFTSGHLALAAMLDGKADFAACAETPLAQAALEGQPFAIVATIAEADRAILIIARKDRGIAGPEDLVGKRVGVVYGTAADFFLDVYLETSGIDPASVRIVGLEAEQIVDAVASGEIDAVSAWPPYTAALQDRLGEGAVVLDEPGLYTLTWNAVVPTDATRRNPRTIARFLRAIVRANRFVEDQPDRARAIVAKAVRMNPDDLKEEWGNYRIETSLDQSLILYLEDEARWMSQNAKEPTATPNFLDHVYATGLKSVRPDAVTIVGGRE